MSELDQIPITPTIPKISRKQQAAANRAAREAAPIDMATVAYGCISVSARMANRYYKTAPSKQGIPATLAARNKDSTVDDVVPSERNGTSFTEYMGDQSDLLNAVEGSKERQLVASVVGLGSDPVIPLEKNMITFFRDVMQSYHEPVSLGIMQDTGPLRTLSLSEEQFRESTEDERLAMIKEKMGEYSIHETESASADVPVVATSDASTVEVMQQPKDRMREMIAYQLMAQYGGKGD